MTTDNNKSERPPRPFVRLVGLLMVIASVFLATYLVVAYFAYESGRTQAARQESEFRSQQITRQIELAEQDMAAGNLRTALTRAEYVLSLDAANDRAITIQQQALAMQNTQAGPTPTPGPAEESLLDDFADTNIIDPLPELQTVRRLIASKRWEEALPRLASFRHQYPDYERRETDKLIYEIYLNLGFQYVNTEKIELGLNYFSQAAQLGSLPQEALDYRLWADLYYRGIAYFGVNYEVATRYLRDLCSAAPFFQNSCARLYEALIGYGDQLAYSLDWCPAEAIYREAWQQRATEILTDKLNQASENCALATPVPLTDTLSITGTDTLTLTIPLTSTGSLTTTVPITFTESGE